jgi:hypothetical protein
MVFRIVCALTTLGVAVAPQHISARRSLVCFSAPSVNRDRQECLTCECSITALNHLNGYNGTSIVCIFYRRPTVVYDLSFYLA